MWTVAQLSADLAAGRITSRDLVEQALARIAAPEGEGARAFLKLYTDTARAEAEFSDRLRRAGIRRSPVDGLPVSLKDLFDVAGDVTRAGSKIRADAPPAKADAPAVARLRAAGAVILGRTNMVEFAFGGVGLNPHFGTPKNPYDRKTGRVPGGSSLDPPAGGAVRRRGIQADGAARPARRRLSSFLHARFHRAARQLGRLLRDVRRDSRRGAAVAVAGDAGQRAEAPVASLLGARGSGSAGRPSV